MSNPHEPGTFEWHDYERKAAPEQESQKQSTSKPRPEKPGDDSGLITPDEPQWPTLNSEALHGLAGEIVHLISPHTEADDAAILYQTLAAFGVAVGRRPHYLSISRLCYRAWPHLHAL